MIFLVTVFFSFHFFLLKSSHHFMRSTSLVYAEFKEGETIPNNSHVLVLRVPSKPGTGLRTLLPYVTSFSFSFLSSFPTLLRFLLSI